MTVMLLSFVIPAYRSAKTIASVIDDIAVHYPSSEIVVVVDGSPDNVAAVVAHLVATRTDVTIKCVELRANRGQHYAVLRGFSECAGDWVVTVDDDGQNPISEIAQLIACTQQDDNWDCVYGSFGDEAKQTLQRRLVSRLNQRLASTFLKKPPAVLLSNVRLIRGDLARLLGRFNSPYPFIDALIFRATKYVTSVPINQRPRASGASGYTWLNLLRLALSHYTIFSTLPLVLGSLVSMGVSAVVFAGTAALVLRAFINGDAPQGWTSLMAVTGFLFSLLFLFLALLSLYVGRLYVSFNSSFADFARRFEAPSR